MFEISKRLYLCLNQVVPGWIFFRSLLGHHLRRLFSRYPPISDAFGRISTSVASILTSLPAHATGTSLAFFRFELYTPSFTLNKIHPVNLFSNWYDDLASYISAGIVPIRCSTLKNVTVHWFCTTQCRWTLNITAEIIHIKERTIDINGIFNWRNIVIGKYLKQCIFEVWYTFMYRCNQTVYDHSGSEK